MWTIARIDEADFGCEERLPGEPRKVWNPNRKLQPINTEGDFNWT
jgi:hypothetical protein